MQQVNFLVIPFLKLQNPRAELGVPFFESHRRCLGSVDTETTMVKNSEEFCCVTLTEHNEHTWTLTTELCGINHLRKTCMYASTPWGAGGWGGGGGKEKFCCVTEHNEHTVMNIVNWPLWNIPPEYFIFQDFWFVSCLSTSFLSPYLSVFVLFVFVFVLLRPSGFYDHVLFSMSSACFR